VVVNVEVFTTLMRLLTRGMPCLLMERLQGNSGYDIDVWVILHLGTLRFYFLVYLLVHSDVWGPTPNPIIISFSIFCYLWTISLT